VYTDLRSFPTRRSSDLSDAIPSCMRAPPDVQTATSARRSTAAASQACAKISPAALPSEPPRKPKSMHARSTGACPIEARATWKRSEEHTSELQSLAYLV